jgi:hypothetical protein
VVRRTLDFHLYGGAFMIHLVVAGLLLSPEIDKIDAYYPVQRNIESDSITFVRVTNGSKVEVIRRKMPNLGDRGRWIVQELTNPSRTLVTKVPGRGLVGPDELFEVDIANSNSEPKLLMKSKRMVTSANWISERNLMYVMESDGTLKFYDASRSIPSLVTQTKTPAGIYAGNDTTLKGNVIFNSVETKDFFRHRWYRHAYSAIDIKDIRNVTFHSLGEDLAPEEAPSNHVHWGNYKGFRFCFPPSPRSGSYRRKYLPTGNGEAYHWTGTYLIRMNHTTEGLLTMAGGWDAHNAPRDLQLVGFGKNYVVGYYESEKSQEAYLFDTTNDKDKIVDKAIVVKKPTK